MAETQETIADIIAEMRGMGNYQQFSGDHARALADRLEAAHRRELAASGNAAKLREALTDAEKTLYDSSRSMYGIPPHLHALLARIRAALSEPPRNCDRFASAEEAWAAYDEWVESYRSIGQTPPFNEFGWLFAPATERKGESNEQK